jgi:hypothetical protein
MRLFENFSRWDALRFALAVILGGACTALVFGFAFSFVYEFYRTPNQITLLKVIDLLATASKEAILSLYSDTIIIVYGIIANFIALLLTLIFKRPFLKIIRPITINKQALIIILFIAPIGFVVLILFPYQQSFVGKLFLIFIFLCILPLVSGCLVFRKLSPSRKRWVETGKI